LAKFEELQALDLVEIRMFDGVGAEKFAEHAFMFADQVDPRKNQWPLLLRQGGMCRTRC
jgi:hypothetical protein